MASKLLLEQAAFLSDFCLLKQHITSLGYIVTSGELLRPIEMQEIYVKTGRSQTMNSQHIKKLAGDLSVFDQDGKYITDYETWEIFGKFWEGLSPMNRYGGNFDGDWAKMDRFVDCPHFERKSSK